MATTKIACPRCRAVLKSSQAPPIGKTIKCPGCGSAFPVTADMVQVVPTSPLAAVPLPAVPAGPVTARPALPVALPAAEPPKPGTVNPARLGYVLGGIVAWLALGAALGYYCFSSNRGTAADRGGGKGDDTAQKKEKEKEKEQPPLVTLPPEQQKEINEAVNRAVRFLRARQLESGSWTNGPWPVGYAGLPGLTLLEAGVPANDPNVQKAAKFVREQGRKTGFEAVKKTYDLALAILFLDRLGDPKDRELIRTLALRLVAGQGQAGGWSYDCPELSTAEESQLYEVLQGSVYAAKDDTKLPDKLRRLPVLNDFSETKDTTPGGAKADNSNTQFATLAVWVARRHEVPLDRTIDFLLRRFRSHEKNGQWDYTYLADRNRVMFVSKEPTMTAAGLLGLAVGIGGAKAGGKGDQEPGVERGFDVLGNTIGEQPGNGRVTNLYYLWSVERVAVLYQRKKIKDKDWYGWGAGMLLPAQKEDGSWSTNSYHGSTPVLDTCFATLFLRQANLAKDLTSKLQRLGGR
jgi:hypothetical protein